MKRLPVAPPTDEDCLILGMRVMRGNPDRVYVLYRDSMLGDRGDAALMLKLARTRVGNRADHLFRATYGLPYWDIEAIVSGWLE